MQLFSEDNKNESWVTPEPDDKIVRQFHPQTVGINGSLSDKVRRFAVQQNCTPFIVLLTVVFVTSYLIFGELEIFCAILMSNRRIRESHRSIGHFLNTVVVGARLTPHQTLEQILKNVRGVTLGAHANQEFPFEQLRRQILNKSGRRPAIRVLFNYQKRSFPAINVAGLTFASYPLPVPVSESNWFPAAYDLIFDIKETTTGLVGTVNVVDDLSLREGRNTNLRFEDVLHLIVSEPKRSLRDVKN
jgi:non-ribosomal peptide synthetase component F